MAILIPTSAIPMEAIAVTWPNCVFRIGIGLAPPQKDGRMTKTLFFRSGEESPVFLELLTAPHSSPAQKPDSTATDRMISANLDSTGPRVAYIILVYNPSSLGLTILLGVNSNNGDRNRVKV